MSPKNEYRTAAVLVPGQSTEDHGEVVYQKPDGSPRKRKVVVRRALTADPTAGTSGLRFDQAITIGAERRG